MIIDGQAVTADASIDVLNPATEQVAGCIADCSREQLDGAVNAARDAFEKWRAVPYSDRQDAMRAIAGVLMDNIDDLKRLLTAEQGKPHAAAQGEIEAAAWWIRQVADMTLPVEVTDAMPGQRSETRYVPLGVVGAIVPWNFPVLLAIWKIGPALLAGNTLVLKPSPFTSLTTLKLAELLVPVLPAGVLNVISGGDALGPWMTGHPGMDKISFTGSTATGRRVMASAAGNLKRLTLELGGNDAAIVLDDVDVDTVAHSLFWAAFANSGQVCVAAKRIYVHDSVYDALAAAMIKIASSARVGNGAEQDTVLGPVQNRPQYERVKALIAESRDAGHHFLTGGEVEAGTGYFISPTIVDNPPENSRVVQEEAFGPVVPLIRYSDLDDAIRLANATEYGLAGSVWSSDPVRAEMVAARLDTGTVWINSAQNLTPFAPFAGAKQSGFGVEGGVDGLLEFTRRHTIHKLVAA